MTSVILMGAGASFGSLDAYRDGADGQSCPPLGNGELGLFACLDALGGVASTLSPELKAAFRNNFEEGMALFRERHQDNTAAFQREMAGYLGSFKPGPMNAYVKLVRAVGIRGVIYSTLNYDLLFELSACRAGYARVRYGTEEGGGAPATTKAAWFLQLLAVRARRLSQWNHDNQL